MVAVSYAAQPRPMALATVRPLLAKQPHPVSPQEEAAAELSATKLRLCAGTGSTGAWPNVLYVCLYVSGSSTWVDEMTSAEPSFRLPRIPGLGA